MTTRIVHCRKLGQDLPGIPYKPFEDELGQRIYDQVSMQAWQEWLQFSVRIINTRGLDLADPRAQQVMREQIEVYFGWAEGETMQTAWTPPKPSES